MNSKKREMIIKRGDSTFDRILAHHINPEAFPLTDKEQEQLDRWYEAFTMQLNHFSRLAIVNVWKKKGLSMSQAYADIKNAESLFGNVLKADKEASRAMWLEWVLDLLKRAKQKSDRKAEAKALDLYAKYSDFDKEDAQFNADKLKDVEIVIKLSAAQEKALEKYGNGSVADFNNLNAINIDFDEVEEGGADERD